MLCIVCGIREEYERRVCRECIIDRVSLNVTGTLDITECPKCGSTRVGKKWYPDDPWKPLSRKVQQIVEPSDITFAVSVNPEEIRISHDGTFTNAKVAITKEGFGEVPFEVNIPTRRLKNSCPTCNKVTGSYYEAVVQIRTLNAEYKDIIEKVKDEAVSIMKNLNRKDPESFISTIKKVPEGLDIYLGKRSDGGKISKYISDNYLSTIKTSKTLAGVRDGEKFYRFTYGARLAALDPGTVISLNGNELLVLNSNSIGIEALDIKRERKTKVSKSEFFLSDPKVIEKEPRKKTFIVVSRENGEMQLMDKNDFSIITIRGDSDEEEVEMFSFGGKYYLPERA